MDSLTWLEHWPGRLEIWVQLGLSIKVQHGGQTSDVEAEGAQRGPQWTVLEAASLLRLGPQLAQHPYCWNPLVKVVLEPT